MCWAAASASRGRLRARSSATCRRCRAANRRWWPSPFISPFSQFIVITHRRGTMEEADVLYGVTMQEDGVSKVLKLDLEHVDASLVS